MSRLIRKYEKDRVYFISNRTAEGLPFVPTMLINLFIYGIIARAIFLQPNVKVCHFLFMGNHYHMIVVLKGDGDAMKSFMEYLDGEIAKLINRFRGRTGQNVWSRTYDAETLLTYESVIEKIVYLYLNPITAGLVSHIKDYPGVSSWKFFSKEIKRSYKFLGSAGLARLPFGGITKMLSCEILRARHKDTKFKDRNLLAIDPFAWVYCFSNSREKVKEEARKEILEKIEHGEDKIKKRRDRNAVIGVHNLTKQCFHKRYTSRKYSRRSICISTCPELKRLFIEDYREFVSICKKAWEKFKLTRENVVWPPGAFPPARLVFGSILSI